MLLKAINKTLTDGQPKTFLTVAATAAGTSLTVKNNAGFLTDDDYYIIGEIGQEKTEIVQNNSSTTVGTTITIDREGAGGGLRFNHDIDTPIYRIDYNQVEFSHAATATGTKSVIQAATAVTPDAEFSRYDDSSNTTGFGFVRFKNATTSGFSVYSAAIPYSGYTAVMLRSMRKKVRRLLDEPDETTIADDEITEELNMAQKLIAHKRLWTFYQKTKSLSTVADQFEYALASDCFKLYKANFETQPLAIIDMHKWDIYRWDADVNGDPTHLAMWRRKAKVYPYPSDGAAATAIDDSGDITSSDTTITVDDASVFSEQGRIIIDSEVISYTGITSGTDLTGCTRGEEGTTAASHLDNAVVTARDVVYRFQEEPIDLADETDATFIPEPSIVCYKAAAELSLPEDQRLHDRLMKKYKDGLEELKSVDGPSVKGTPMSVRDVNETVRDFGPRDPNQYPTGLS